MTASQIDSLHKELVALLTKYGVEKNYLFSYILIDEVDGNISGPTIANITEITGHGVSTARASGFLAEIICGTLLSLMRRYNGLDIMGSAGAVKGMIDEARGTQMLEMQMQAAQKNTRPEA
jgi:hypothetical protein